MKLALFSDNVSEKHVVKLKSFFTKPLREVKFLYITTATNYKPYQPDWSVESESRWREIFPLLRQFDLERAYKVDPNFDFKTYFESFDFIFVSGGNVFLLSYWMNKTGADKILKELILSNKIVYGGESAGAIYPYNDMSLYAELDNPEKAPKRIDQAMGLLILHLYHTGKAKIFTQD